MPIWPPYWLSLKPRSAKVGIEVIKINRKKSKRKLDTIQYKMRDQGVRKVFSTSVTAFKVIGQESRFRGKTILTGPVGHYVGAILGKLYGLGQ